MRKSTSRWLIPFLFVSYILLFRTPEDPPVEAEHSAADLALKPDFASLVLEIERAHSIEPGSLTAILPVTQESLAALPDTLSPFLSPSSCVSKVLVVCPESLLPQSRAAVRQVVRSAPQNLSHPDVSLHSWGSAGDPTAVALQAAAAHARTKWLLILDDAGLHGLSARTRDMLLCPVAAALPTGPRGVIGSPGNRSCVLPSAAPLPASYLLPPFTLPSSLAQKVYNDWFDPGRSVSQARKDRLGGVVRGYGDPDASWCTDSVRPERSSASPEAPTPFLEGSGLFVFLLPNIHDLNLVRQLLCGLYESGHSIKILVYASAQAASGVWESSLGCPLQYDAFAGQKIPLGLGIHDWLGRMEGKPDIIFAISDPATQSVASNHAIVVRVPHEDLRHVHWMGSLSLTEWKNWNVPRIDISIITQDRPHSLARLLSSLSQGRFFGDSVTLRLNMEQSSDLETIRMVGAFRWGHGAVFAHRRVIHGGLLPAVVESWYPHSNDSYGLLLEDDVELSPLFYAWIKMGILRYRYGEDRGHTAQLFGISLYQQKNIELHPEGRKAFDPRRLFRNSNVSDPSTPYLSQIPCSWGAVYFPEHWREFHDYLAGRLSEATMEIERTVVPGVRSNHWTKSWKKYFIELVYLRGYVMLYPNYAGFRSLSTNHLEVGSHVKERPREKQEEFRLPLLELSGSCELLDLPGGRLPGWRTLPVLNLTGCITSLEYIGSM